MRHFGRTKFRRDNPFNVLGFHWACRAEDSRGNGSVTQTVVPYIGNVELTRTGTGQAIKSGVGLFGYVTFNGVAGAAGYSASVAVPAAVAVATVWRAAATGSACHAFTVGGAANTGTADGLSGANAFSQKIGTAALTPRPSLPAMLIILSVFNAAGSTIYVNSTTGVTSALAGALAGDTYVLGSLTSPSGTFTMSGDLMGQGRLNREPTAFEVRQIMTGLARQYQISGVS